MPEKTWRQVREMCQLFRCGPLVESVKPDAYADLKDGQVFYLENGGTELSNWFTHVELIRYADSLKVTDAVPLCDYVESAQRLDRGELTELREILEGEIAERGVIIINKAPGLFLAES